MLIRVTLVFLIGFNLIIANQAVFSYSKPGVVTNQKHNQEASQIINYQYLTESEISKLSQNLFPQLRININTSKKTINIIGTRQDRRRFSMLVRNMDRNISSIEFSTQLIEVNTNKLKRMGIDWPQYFNQLKATGIRGSSAFFKQISLLLRSGEAHILANPVVISIEEREASLVIGEKIPYVTPQNNDTGTTYQLNYLNAGIEIKIRGRVISGNIIVADVAAKVSNIKQWKATQGGEYPVLSSREVNIQCQIEDSKILVLGGLVGQNKRKNRSSFPILGDLPFIGEFFQSETEEKDDTEILFTLSPRIVRI